MFVGVAVVVSCLASRSSAGFKVRRPSAYKVLAKEEGVWDAEIKMMYPAPMER